MKTRRRHRELTAEARRGQSRPPPRHGGRWRRRAARSARRITRRRPRSARRTARRTTRSARRIARSLRTTTAGLLCPHPRTPSRRSRKPTGSRCQSYRGRGSPRPRRSRRSRPVRQSRPGVHPTPDKPRLPHRPRRSHRPHRRRSSPRRSPGTSPRPRIAPGRRPQGPPGQGRQVARAGCPRTLDAAGRIARGPGGRDEDRPVHQQDGEGSRPAVHRHPDGRSLAPSPRQLVNAYYHELVQHRLVTLGGSLGFVLICLAAISGYIRADEATKGYYTNRLRMLAAAGVGAAGVIVYRMVA